MASSSAVGKLSREDYRKQKDLEAARKAGTAPAELDQEGKPINPHIPQYISQAPWYLDTGRPSLSHQRKVAEAKEVVSDIDKWYDRGKKVGPAVTKYRKGACENCGAISHQRQDCLDRPRKRGAKYTGKDIQADDVIPGEDDLASGYDAKRDRWNGYDASQYQKIFEEYAAVEAARQKLREEEIDKQTTTDLAAVRKVAKAAKGDSGVGDAEFGSSEEDDDDEEKYADAADAVGQKLDTKTRITVRNLRIREDTAKYLINLDPESAYYDPKTRSMRDAPIKNVPAEDAKFAGDNFARFSGEAEEVQRLQLFAWQSTSRGNDVHMNANPTSGEIVHKQYNERKQELRQTLKSGILEKYGGEQYLEKAPKELLQGQTEEYVEYSRTGQVIKGQERVKAKSRYLEDVYINNHTAVWGSWYDLAGGKWGYACCHAVIHASYCVGAAGIEVAKASDAHNILASIATSARSESKKSAVETQQERVERDDAEAQKGRGREEKHVASARWKLGEGDVQLDETKLREAMDKERKRKARAGEDEDADAEEDGQKWGRKRKYNSNLGAGKDNYEVTEEQLEAYRRSRIAGTEDPMFNYKDSSDS